MWGRDGPGEVGVEVPANKEADSMEDEERGESERLAAVHFILIDFKLKYLSFNSDWYFLVFEISLRYVCTWEK